MEIALKQLLLLDTSADASLDFMDQHAPMVTAFINY